jgi:hypothetical protein
MRVDVNASLVEFFRNEVERAQQNQKVKLLEDTQFYLVNLLTTAIETNAIFISENAGHVDEPLALIYGRAMAAETWLERFQLLKKIGDRSLYVSGFFSDSLNRKSIDIDYYIAMGGTAYNFVSQVARDRQEVFNELSAKFTKLVNLISEISEAVGMTNDQDLLRLYERWLQTKDDRLRERLKDKGILPVDSQDPSTRH